MKIKTIPLFIIILMIVGGGAFYGGIKYGQGKNPLSGFSRQGLQNLPLEQRQQFIQKRSGMGFISGEVIDKDKQSLTIKTPDGSTKLVFFSNSTQISKTIEGSIDDIEIGKQIMVGGKQNPDRSYTAKIIQISPRFLIPRNSD